MTELVRTGRRAMRGRGIGAAACCLASVVAAPAHAQFGAAPNNQIAPTLTFDTDYMGYSASVGPRVSYSDNINLATDGFEQDATILSTVLSGAAIYSANAFTGLIQGDLDVSYLPDGGDVNVTQQVAGVGTFTLAENLLYFDVAGATSRQLVGDNARFSRNVNAGRNQRANVHNFSLSPYINTRFDNGSAAEVRYRFSQVFVDDSESIGGGFLNDSQSHEVALGYDTGDIFDDLNLKFTAYGARTDESGAFFAPEFSYDQGSLMAEAEYALTPRFALTGAVGYDEISSDAPAEIVPADELSGFNWLAGFRYRPNRRTDLLLQYGERFGDDYLNASLSYSFNDTLQFRAGGSRFFQTRAQAVNSQFALSQRRVLDFADQLRNAEEGLAPTAVIEGATNVFERFGGGAQAIGVGASTVYDATLIASLSQTRLSVSGLYSSDDFSFRQVETFGGNVNVQRDLSRRASVYGDLFYRFADTAVDVGSCIAAPALFGFDVTAPGFSPADACNAFARVNGETSTVGAVVGGRYRFYRNLSAFGEYSYTTRLSDEPLLEFTENFVQIGITLDF